jgi:hypothetical protein
MKFKLYIGVILPLPNVMDVDELWEMDLGSCSLLFFPMEYALAHGNALVK